MKKAKIDLMDVFAFTISIITAIVCIFPFIYIISVSLTDPSVYVPFQPTFFPRKFSLSAYQALLSTPAFTGSLKNTLIITILGVPLNLLITYALAYGLTYHKLPGHKFVMGMVVFGLLFSAGMIPNYLMVKNLGLINSYWALILPTLTSSYNTVIALTFVKNIPDDIFESARIDGCNELTMFIKMVIPLSAASIATLALFFAVSHWNEYFNALIYLSDFKKRTLQVYVKTLLSEASGAGSESWNVPSETLRQATVVLAMLPILAAYPFAQKYFVKGVMLGSVKG